MPTEADAFVAAIAARADIYAAAAAALNQENQDG
jgi:hypothetical protein